MADIEYIRERNRLIPHAVRIADHQVRRTNWMSNERYAREWNQAFLATMDRLAKECRLCVPFREIAGPPATRDA